jgi:hypothetical protein
MKIYVYDRSISNQSINVRYTDADISVSGSVRPHLGAVNSLNVLAKSDLEAQKMASKASYATSSVLVCQWFESKHFKLSITSLGMSPHHHLIHRNLIP